jgi:hypothetical protein
VNGVPLTRLASRKPHHPTGVVRVARAPDGTEWEISSSRLVPPKWRPAGVDPSLMSLRGGPVFDENPVSAILGGMVWPMLRYMAELPAAIAKGRNSKVIWVAARSYYPVQEAYYWTTSADHVVGAIDDVARGLEAGETVPRTMRAFYYGTRQDWTPG